MPPQPPAKKRGNRRGASGDIRKVMPKPKGRAPKPCGNGGTPEHCYKMMLYCTPIVGHNGARHESLMPVWRS